MKARSLEANAIAVAFSSRHPVIGLSDGPPHYSEIIPVAGNEPPGAVAGRAIHPPDVDWRAPAAGPHGATEPRAVRASDASPSAPSRGRGRDGEAADRK